MLDVRSLAQLPLRFIAMQGGVAVAWLLVAAAQSTTQPSHRDSENPVVAREAFDPAAPKLRFQLSDGSVDLMKALSLGSFAGIGGSSLMIKLAKSLVQDLPRSLLD
jgi:hypothetical protein